jgi:FSR family fosmidomycin resistance protein-like MFS transporter
MIIHRRVWLLGLGHGINDLVAGYFLGVLVQDGARLAEAALGLIIYNLLAFGGQYPAALLLERKRSPKQFLVLAYGLNIIAVGISSFLLPMAIVLAGIASALYHVAGGSVCARDNRAIEIGFFAAPGVMGLVAGGYFAYGHWNIQGWLLFISIVIMLALVWGQLGISATITGDEGRKKTSSVVLDRHDIIMILLLSVIALRSMVWNVFQLIHENNYTWLLAIALSAALGKILGSWIADRVGWRIYAMASLAVATPLISLFRKELVLLCIGIGILQSGIPATTALLIRSMGGKTERAIGLSFGTAIILGALLFYTPFRRPLFSNWWIVFAGIFALGLLWLATRRRIRLGEVGQAGCEVLKVNPVERGPAELG